MNSLSAHFNLNRITFDKTIELFYEIQQEKTHQVTFVFDLMNAATRESCDVLANLAATNSQGLLKFGEIRKKRIIQRIKGATNI
jgi:hypothetical protein